MGPGTPSGTTDRARALLAPTLGAAAALGAATVAWAALEAHRFTLREVTVPVLAPGSSPLRVLHVSDVHLVPGQADKVAWLRDLASLEPDLVVDTGDNFGAADALTAVLDSLEPLLALPGAFVLGSNDYYAPVRKNPLRYFRSDPRLPVHHAPPDLPAEAFVRALRDAGWADLTNRRDTLELGTRRIELVGVDDPHIDRDAFPAPASSAPGTEPSAADATSTGTALRLGLTHAPYQRVLADMQHDGVDLVLAGHTHGGQLCVPGFGALVTNCDIDRRRVSGLHGWPGPRPDDAGGKGSLWLHVSAGVGTSPQVRLRLACLPSATLLTLVPREP